MDELDRVTRAVVLVVDVDIAEAVLLVDVVRAHRLGRRVDQVVGPAAAAAAIKRQLAAQHLQDRLAYIDGMLLR